MILIGFILPCNTVEPLYITATIGKWHLALIERWPLERGPAFFCCLHALVTYPYMYIRLSLRMCTAKQSTKGGDYIHDGSRL